MHDIIFIELFECLEKLSEVDECLWFWKEFLFFDKGFDGAFIAVFVDKIEVVGSFESLVEFHNMIILQRR